MSRRIIVALVALVSLATSADAYLTYELENVHVVSYGVMVSGIREIVPDGFSAKRQKNLGKAIDRLDTDPETMEDLLDSFRSGAKPLARAISDIVITDVTTRAIIAVLVGLARDLDDIADDLEDRMVEAGWEDLGGPYAMTAQPSGKKRRKLAKLLGQARIGIRTGGGNDTLVLGKKGKELKRRAGALLDAIEKLQKLERKLESAGL